jgi:hypothetical protein
MLGIPGGVGIAEGRKAWAAIGDDILKGEQWVTTTRAQLGKGTGGGSPAVQRLATDRVAGATPQSEPTAIAAQGMQGSGEQLPHGAAIQRAFGDHDVSSVRAHVGGPAADASRALGASAYAQGDSVAFASTPDLHTAAHEAAHVVQQRGGVQLTGGIDGGAGDPHERQANAVADAVVSGESAEPLLGGGSDSASAGVHGD